MSTKKIVSSKNPRRVRVASSTSGRRTKTAKLANPAVVTAATLSATSVIPFIIKTIIIGGIVAFVYHKYTNRFTKIKENPAYPAANVNISQAVARANSIASSKTLFGNSFDNVRSALAGLNYNGFIRVYNAFGHQKGSLFTGDHNLITWLNDQFSADEMQQLSFLLGGAFFKEPIAIDNKISI